ncbi:uncharacterized protein LOC103865769 isoform X3 [Brassica rapa]|uniref:uncharacterized protein LOC103865769 isoform X3 n=1 Tax=Brassica campestris TaxID=3711 RepID=UPI00142DE939|nr:uncharacterized protein LOC103865769 isoform X3 [Brassica rapa]
MKRRKRKQQRRSSSFTPASSFDRPQFKKVRALDAMAAFPNLNSDAGLKKLDEHLLTRYYITSHKASKDDITIYAALSKSPPSKYVNASRWYDHIETLLSISGISSEGSGVTIDGSASITEEADGNSKDGVVVIDDDDNDQDVDLIGEEAEERPASLIASTKKKISWESIVIVVMPEDDETDMNKLEEQVRSIQMEGLVWGASKVVSVGYGVKLLRIIGTVPLDEEIYVFDGIVETHIMSFGRVNVATSGLYESLILIQPNEDEADMKKLEETVRSIHVAGLFWGASKLVPVGCGIKLLGIECTTVGHLVHLRRIVTLNTFVKEKIADNPYVKSCQTLCLNRIFNGIKEEESDSKDDVDLFGEERAGPSRVSSKSKESCKSGLVLKRLLGDKPDIKKLEESVRSLQTEGVVWGACKLMDLLHYIVNNFFLISSFISIFIATIVKLGYGFKYLRIIFTIVDDLVCFKTVLQKTGGIHLKRICKYLKSILLTSQNL